MNGINEITFEIGYKCNGNCTYCFQKNRKYQTEILSVDSAVSLIKKLEDESRLKPDFKVMLFGGESLLFLDWIKEFVAKTEKKYPVKITTNGTLLTEEVIKDLISLKINPTISVDGGFLTQAENRGENLAEVEVFQRINNTIQLMRENNLSPLCQSTFTPSTVGRLFESYLFIRHLGFSQWWYELESISEIGANNWNDISFAIYRNQIQEVLKFQKIQPSFRLLNLEFLIENNKKDKKQVNRLYVDVNGNITYSAIGILRLDNENMNIIKLGNIEQGIDFQKIKKMPPIANAPVNPLSEKCNRCSISEFCILDEGIIGKIQDKTNCAWWKILGEEYYGLQ